MTLLIRFILIVIIIYLLVRSFVRYFAENDTSDLDHESQKNSKSGGVSKKVGEYIDYEDVD
jgi:hypothetical protein